MTEEIFGTDSRESLLGTDGGGDGEEYPVLAEAEPDDLLPVVLEEADASVPMEQAWPEPPEEWWFSDAFSNGDDPRYAPLDQENESN